MRAEQDSGSCHPQPRPVKRTAHNTPNRPPPGVTSANGAGVPDLNLVADSVDEDRAVIRGRSRRAQGTANSPQARATSARDEAQRALDLAVSALAEADGLRRAMQTRADIDMAKGILMERHRISAQEAFDMLKAHSQKHHAKLVDVARAVVAATTERLE